MSVAANFAPLPHLELTGSRPELPPPNDGPVQWRERWDFVLTPIPGSQALGEAIDAHADLQFDLPPRLTMIQDGEVSGFVSGRLIAVPLTPPEGVVLARGAVTLVVGNVAPVRALALELYWSAPDGRFCLLNGHGNGVRADSLDGIQLALRLSWRTESPIQALGQSMTFLMTRVMHPSQLPPPPPEPEGLWKRLTGRFRRP